VPANQAINPPVKADGKPKPAPALARIQICKAGSAAPVPATFMDCLHGALSGANAKANDGLVPMQLAVTVIANAPANGDSLDVCLSPPGANCACMNQQPSAVMPLGHEPECPFMMLAKRAANAPMPAPKPGARIKMAVVSIPRDVDGRFLITRRAPHMRSWPGAWYACGRAVVWCCRYSRVARA